MAGRATRWEVQIFERKRDPDLRSRLVEHGGRKVPQDTIPRLLETVHVVAKNVDDAMRKVRDLARRRGVALSALNVSADAGHRLVAYLFEKESKK